jgi:hypothetical protein
MSQQIIEVLDYLFEKFGIAIDWTAENVMPYVQELAGKIVTYNVVTEALWIGLPFITIIGCCIYACILYRSYKVCNFTKSKTMLFDVITNYNGDFKRSEMSCFGGTLAMIFGFLALLAVITIGVHIGDLLKWIFIPELQLVEYISNLVNTVQM